MDWNEPMMNLFGLKKSDSSIQRTEIEDLRLAIGEAQMPLAVQAVARHELERLSRMGQSTAEYSIIFNYLDYLISLPWDKSTDDNLDLARAEMILTQEHYGLDDIKARIIEYLAVRTLRLEKKYRIIVVDDEEIIRDSLQHVLEKEGYVVVTAANGTEALQLIESSRFDLILADLKMDGLDGLTLLEKTRSLCPETAFIMMTGYATIDSAVETLKKGAFHYLAKPFKLEDLRETVGQSLKKRMLVQETRGPILCFTGPPGTGKTSLGKSIAHALGRRFVRLSLGGMKDEAEIRGHRRTYVGALPGRIIHEIREIGCNNPVFMLDEIDKIGQDFRGDPASALLEVLDPEQNAHFTDYYLDVPFDLSRVIFITTANVIDNIPNPLRDRLEILKLSGYTEEEKKNIAARYLIPRQIEEAGLSVYPPNFTDAAIYKIIREYTREAGVRNLERQIGSICRKLAKEIVTKREDNVLRQTIIPDAIERYLGPRKFSFEVTEARDRVGVTTGLVWTESGGDIIFVEATRMKGRKDLIMTGSLGEIMQESARAALSYIRSHARIFNIPENFFDFQDIHVHVPAAAMPKDGPSAGITIAMAIISVLTERPARRDVAMTGELTLSGRILPVGAVKEKILAARRAGVRMAVFPRRNRIDVEDLPPELTEGIEIIYVDDVRELIDLVLK
ncbi:MAG: endopeptidase La [Desulfovibrionales bacterium]|nr:endopeptidase La [Desulfovibrionales bacterium]